MDPRFHPSDIPEHARAEAMYRRIPRDHPDYFEAQRALLGAMAAHSGQRVTWDELWASELDLAPDELAMSDDFAPGPIPVPGRFEI